MASSAPAASTVNPAALCGVTLVLGGARAGKSAYAETLVRGVLRPGERATYIATAEPRDAEMADRIAAHRAGRGAIWDTRETPLELVACLREESRGRRPILVDCLTLWVANLLGAGRDVGHETEYLIAALHETDAPVVLVSNEVGLGIVPDNALARSFRDHAGRLHQAVAATAERVIFVAAGLPIILKEKK